MVRPSEKHLRETPSCFKEKQSGILMRFLGKYCTPVMQSPPELPVKGRQSCTGTTGPWPRPRGAPRRQPEGPTAHSPPTPDGRATAVLPPAPGRAPCPRFAAGPLPQPTVRRRRSLRGWRFPPRAAALRPRADYLG